LILLLPLALSVLGIAAEYLFPPEHVLARLFIAFPFQHIGIGGIYGLVAFSGHPLALRFRENLFRTSSQLILYVLLLSVMLYGVFFQILNFTVYSVLFGAMILNLAFNEKSLLRLDARILEHLGQRSFGIYMVHIFSLRYVLQFCRSQGLSWFWVYAFGITVSILLAELVYYVLERPFLKRKEKYRVIGSGTD
jgi:peptidoglycan/LPS O-acetylase OafA/YrhL